MRTLTYGLIPGAALVGLALWLPVDVQRSGAAYPSRLNRQDELAADSDENVARITVTLPPGTRLTIDGKPTRSTAETRVFTSPPLSRGKKFVYTLQAAVIRDGKTVAEMREVTVWAGADVHVSLLVPHGEGKGKSARPAPPPAADNEMTDEFNKLQGTWKAASVKVGHRTGVAEVIGSLAKSQMITNTGDESVQEVILIGKQDGQERFVTKRKMRIDPTKTPKTIDFTDEEGNVKLRAIYRLSGDTLTICQSGSSLPANRPTKFEAEPGSGINLLVLKRIKKSAAK